jgi:hypothetical protein
MQTISNDTRIADLGIYVPGWIRSNIMVYDVCQISDNGCRHGVYMPAEIYQTALDSLNEYEVQIFDWLDEYGPPSHEVVRGSIANSWSSLACEIMCAAVESWALVVKDKLDVLYL